MAKQYTEAEFAALIRAENPERFEKFSDSSVVQQTLREYPKLKARVLAPVAPEPEPAAPAQPSMRELGLQAFKAMAGQVAAITPAGGIGPLLPKGGGYRREMWAMPAVPQLPAVKVGRYELAETLTPGSVETLQRMEEPEAARQLAAVQAPVKKVLMYKPLTGLGEEILKTANRMEQANPTGSPVELARQTIAGFDRLIGSAIKGATVLDLGLIFGPSIARSVADSVKATNWYRKLSIPERGLVLSKFPGMNLPDAELMNVFKTSPEGVQKAMAVHNPRMRVLLQGAPEARPAATAAAAVVPAAVPALAQVAAPAAAAKAAASILPAARQAEFRPTQVAVLQDVIARGDISPDEIATLVFDKAKDGVTLRTIIERRMAELPPLPGGAVNPAVVKAAADEFHGFLQGVKKTAAAQEGIMAPAAETIAAKAEAAAAIPEPPAAPAGKVKPWDMGDQELYNYVNEKGSFISAGKTEKEIIADLKKWSAMGAERKWAAEAEIARGRADRVPPEVIKKFKLGKMVKNQAELEAANRADAIEAMRQEYGTLFPALQLVKKAGYLNKQKVIDYLQMRPGIGWKGGEIPDELAWYIRPSGEMSPDGMAQLAFQRGEIPENNTELFLENMAKQHAMKVKMEAGGDITEIRGGVVEPKFQTGLTGVYAARKPAPRLDLPGLFDEPKRAPAGDVSTAAPVIDQPAAAFQPITGDKEFKLWQATDDLINKYALRFGERQYIPRGAVGVFYQDTKNIYLQAANNVYVAIHEIAHFIDLKTGFFKRILEVTGTTKNGLPIYSKEHAQVRKLLSQFYLDTYLGAKPSHPLKKRVKEGFAMLMQKAVESPGMLKLDRWKELAELVLGPNGKYHYAEFDGPIADTRKIMETYAALDPLHKTYSRVGTRPPVQKTYFSTLDTVNEQLFDRGHKVYKLAKRFGGEFGVNSPYTQLYAHRQFGSIAESNMGDPEKGLWILLNNNLVKVGDENIATLFKKIGTADDAKMFDAWLIDRRVRAGYQQIEARRQHVLELTEGIYDLAKPKDAVLKLWLAKQEILLEPEQFKELRDDIEQGVEDYKEAAKVAVNDNISRELAEAGYQQGLQDPRYKEWAKIHDAIKRAGVDMLEDVGMVSHKVAAMWRADESYASFKRDIFYLTSEGEIPAGAGGMSIGALKERTGSELNIAGPLHSMATNHAEIIRKTMRQMVVNKFYIMVQENPEALGELFQIPQGGVGFKAGKPDLGNPNFWFARENGKYKPLGVLDTELKETVESMLMSPESIGAFEKGLTTASRLFVKGTTSWNPFFTIGNIFVDTGSAAAQTQTGYKPFWDQMKMLKKMALTENSDEARFLNEYLIMGGHRNTLAGFLDENITPEKMYRKMVGETTKLEKLLQAGETVGDLIAAPSMYSEDFTRAAEYIRSRMAGETSVIAMEKAGQVSTPFHHHGKMGGAAGRIALKATAYVNPALQVAAQFAKTLGNKPTRKRGVIVMTALAAMLITSNYAIRTASDAQKRNYRGLPVRLKQNYIWYPLPGEKARVNGWLGKVKIPSNWAVVGNLFNMMIDDALMGARYSANEYIQMATSPVPDQLNLTDDTRMFFSLVPRIMAPTLEVKMGKKTFPQVSDLTPRDLQGLPLAQQATEDTSIPAVLLARTRLGKALNLSPIEIDHLVEGTLGTWIRILTMRFGLKKTFTRPFYTEMYLSGMRDLEFYYNLRDQVNRESAGARALEMSPEGFTATPEFERLMEFKEPVEAIDLGLKEYRAYGKIKNPTEEEQAELRKLRTKILDDVEQLWIKYEQGLDKK